MFQEDVSGAGSRSGQKPGETRDKLTRGYLSKSSGESGAKSLNAENGGTNEIKDKQNTLKGRTE